MKNEIIDFVRSYKGVPVSFVMAGAGIGIAEILKVPGASKVCTMVFCPYSEGVTQHLIENWWNFRTAENGTSCFQLCETEWIKHKCPYKFPYELGHLKAVSPSVAYVLSRYGRFAVGEGKSVGVTGALTTNRYRKGDNEAFISITDEDWETVVYHREFDKLEPRYYDHGMDYSKLHLETRENEDTLITKEILTFLETNNVPHNWTVVQPTA